MTDHLPSDERITDALRRKRLTFAQRRKHLDRLERAIGLENDGWELPQRRGRAEFGVLAAGLALLLGAFVIWTAVLDDGSSPTDPQDEPELALDDGTAFAVHTASVEEAPPGATPGFDAARGVCRTTPFSTDLIPGVPRNDIRYLNWYGNQEAGLWAAPMDYGAMLPSGWPEASTLWFSGGATPIGWYGASNAIVVTGERLDGDARVGPIVGASTGVESVQSTSITIPEPGCWMLTGTAGQASLSLVVEVLPLEERPDIAIAEQYYAARPYDVPSTCPVTARSAPSQRGAGHHWLQSGGLRAEFDDLLFAGKEQTVGVFGEDVTSGLELVARKLNSDADEQQEAITALWNSDARLALFSIPSSGCWELNLETPSSSVTFVVYVYPAECEPELRDGKFVAACEPPRE